ncbi:hypothetical protein ACFFGH_12025 [Lysobacter korlensis]|uniref:DUF306 domain-containing protein n=1 Tax=Lysobacter korlensis TaxID=553636 RepID=A0ABV6RQ60_9GAMM
MARRELSALPRRRWLPVVVALLVGGTLWSAASVPAGTAARPLDGDWLLIQARDSVGRFAVLNAGISLTVRGQEASGYAGCGEYRVSLSGTAPEAEFSTPVELQSATAFEVCAPPLMQVRVQYLAALRSSSRATVEGRALRLSGPDTELVFWPAPRFPEAQLSGTSWVLEQYGETWSRQQNTPMSRPSTLQFLDDGKFSAVLACRSSLGFYRVAVTQVSAVLHDVRSSPFTYCPRGAAVQDLFVSRVLDQFRAAVQGDRLTLTRDRLQLVYRKTGDASGAG